VEALLALALAVSSVFVSADTLEAPSAPLVDRTWEWVETVDADSTVYKPDSTTAGRTLLFHADGKFEESYPRGCCDYKGTWELYEATLTLHYSDERRSDSVTYQIVKLTRDELVLGVRGRHGTILERFAVQSSE